MKRKPFGERAIEDIPKLRSAERRAEALFVDCYDDSEALAALEVYLTDALRMPFEAFWRKQGESGVGKRVMVMEVAGTDKREQTLLEVRLGNRTLKVTADQVWAVEERSWNAIVLNDYRAWYDNLAEFDEDEKDE